MNGIKLTFLGDSLEINLPGQEAKKGTFKLFPDKSPARIDLIMPHKGLGLGIYKLEGDRLHLAVNDYNDGRPASFAPAPGSKAESLVLERVGGKAGKVAQFEVQKLRAENEKLRAELNKVQADLEAIRRILQDGKDPGSAKATADALALLLAKLQAERQQQDALQEKDQAEDALQKAKQAADRARSANNLKQIGLAMHNYHDQHKTFPAAAIYSKDGKPLLSWRVAILPYIEQDNLYRQFKLDEPWDSPHNIKLLDALPKIYAPVGKQAPDKKSTFYQVFTGPKTLFEGSKGSKFTQIKDGTSNTVLAVEAGKAVPWTKPDDLEYKAGQALPRLGGQFGGGFNMLLADGSVRFVPAGFNENVLRHLITIADGQPVDFDKLFPNK
jgi:uncharacterized protein (TIGR03067 family)/prepilin-type processing-associated H-X9-DG protein